MAIKHAIGEYNIVPISIVYRYGLDPFLTVVYTNLWSHKEKDNFIVYVNGVKLAEKLSISRRKVTSCLKLLQDFGLIYKIKRDDFGMKYMCCPLPSAMKYHRVWASPIDDSVNELFARWNILCKTEEHKITQNQLESNLKKVQ
jgi:hypothetical protein